MATSIKEVTKVALFLQPINLLDNEDILQSIHIEKTNKGPQYFVTELNDGEIRKRYNNLPPIAKDPLHKLSTPGLNYLASQLKKNYQLQRSGKEYETYYRNAYSRHILQQFEQLKPFAHLVKWYHHLPNSKTGNMMTSPCSFSTYKPSLAFKVIMQNQMLQLQIAIEINNDTYPLETFNRFEFLLESKGAYFLLPWKQYQTLLWLASINQQQFAHDASLFAQQVLAPLEADYTVDRNNLFKINTIDAEPVLQVLLSEISNSFLVLTPQFCYDGYVAEGQWAPTYEMLKGGEKIVVNRNKEIETQFVKFLEALHPNFIKQLNGYFYLSFADAQKKQWFLKVYHQLLDMDVQLIGMDMLSHFRYSAHKPVTTFTQLVEQGNSLTSTLTLSFGSEEVPLSELQKILLAGQKAVMLKDGTLGILGDEWLAQYGALIKHSKLNKAEITMPKWMAISEQNNQTTSQLFKVTINNDWWHKWEQWQQPNQIIYPVPPQIKATLRTYQQKGYEWIKLLSEVNAGACLADDMGLGKTLQTICFLVDKLAAATTTAKALIICPSSLLFNWQKEIEKFAPHLCTYVHHGPARNLEKLETDTVQVCITSYGTLRSDAELMANITFEVAVVDESHNIKNPNAKNTQAVNQIVAKNKVALSGTPVMNNTFDLYSQLQFLLPGMFGSREFFKREYAEAIDRDRDKDKIATLQKLTAPFILRRTKEQVAKDLPAKTESILWCSMGNAQMELYNNIKEGIKSNLFTNISNQGFGKSKLAVLQGIMKLKQICASPLLLPQDEQTTSFSVKTDLLLNEIENLGSHKVLVFSQFKTMLDLLGKAFNKKGVAYYQLDGSTPAKKRAELVAAFQEENNEVNIFLISLMAGNTGLTLTATDYVFMYDPWWNDAVQQQAIDRTHRIGQTKNVFAYKMICKNTIEEKIMQLQQKKTDLSDNLIGNEEGFVKALTKDDVEFLFS
jgi:hypothetical protein